MTSNSKLYLSETLDISKAMKENREKKNNRTIIVKDIPKLNGIGIKIGLQRLKRINERNVHL